MIVNHGASHDVINNLWSKAKEFFDLPLSQKESVSMSHDYPYGYLGFGGEVLSKSSNVAGLPDLKESHCIGPSSSRNGHVLFPSGHPEIEAAWSAYYDEVCHPAIF